jgi:hypothetical protein
VLFARLLRSFRRRRVARMLAALDSAAERPLTR